MSIALSGKTFRLFESLRPCDLVPSCPTAQNGTAFTWPKPKRETCISQNIRMHKFLSLFVLRKFMTVVTRARHWSAKISQN